MKYSILLIVIATSLLACNKNFDHQDITPDYPCDCCDVADSIDGDYLGTYQIIGFTGLNGTTPVFDTILDSILTISVDKMPDEDYITNALKCKFNVSGIINYEGFLTDINYGTTWNGITYDWTADMYPLPYNLRRFYSDGTVSLNRTARYTNSSGIYVYYDSISFLGIKQ